MARKSVQPTSDTECINVSMGAPLRFQSRLRSSYIYGLTIEQVVIYIIDNIIALPGTALDGHFLPCDVLIIMV